MENQESLERVSSRHMKQIYRLVELDYLLDGIPSKELWDKIDFPSYQLLSLYASLREVKLHTVDGMSYFCPLFESLGPSPQKVYKLMIAADSYKQNYMKTINRAIKIKS